MRGLIVNADDCGLTAGVNRGIITAYTQGIVTSTTLMVNMPGFTDAVEKVSQNPGLAVGLHLNLTYGVPVLASQRVPSLVGPAGFFFRQPESLLANGLVSEMREELWAQIGLFRKTGLILSHLDTHHHIHKDDRVLDLVAEIARELGVSIRSLEPEKVVMRGLTPKARFQNYFGESDGSRRLIDLIRALPAGITEIPCHPGYCDDELKSLSTLNVIRERELAALTDPLVINMVKECGIKLVNYREV